MTAFATGKIALGDCDRCGFTFKLKELKFLTIRMKATKIRVCPECFESDHPQFKLGTMKIFDPQALQDPRPADNADRVLTPPVSPTTGDLLY
jgi:hypothetical protein